MIRFIACCLALALSGCNRSEAPNGPESAPAATRHMGRKRARPKPTPEPAPPSASASGLALTDAGADADANGEGADAASAEPELGALAPKLVGQDGGVLEQTKEEPSLQSAWFQAGVRAVFRAIKLDDPSVAEPFFFPIEAYRQVKDVADPDRDWKRRLIANFRRDVHDYHKKLGPQAAEARFAGIDVPVEHVRWMKPHSEGNKLPYFRVTHSRLRYETAEGKKETLELTSFISWRGEWYLVHLNGFK
jgi:hypothetical protein